MSRLPERLAAAALAAGLLAGPALSEGLGLGRPALPEEIAAWDVAVLPDGTQVVVKGKNEAGDWVRVAISWDEIDYGYYGAEGWMRDFLFADADGNMSFNLDLLSVVEE